MAKPDAAATTLVSILMPVVDTPVHVLNAAIASVLGQQDERWELCICDDGSSRKDTLALLDYYRGLDPRIKIACSPRRLHRVGATNLAATFATGRYVGFLDPSDVLTPAALATVARVVEAEPAVDLLDTDGDGIAADGSFTGPTLMPEWSSEHRGSARHLLRFLVLRKSLFLRIGGLHEADSDAPDHDLALRAGAAGARIVHMRLP